jgi:hypothetical protein
MKDFVIHLSKLSIGKSEKLRQVSRQSEDAATLDDGW